MHTNLTFGENDGRCLECKSRTVLITWSHNVETQESAQSKPKFESHEVNDEIAGHYCEKCHKVTAIFINN